MHDDSSVSTSEDGMRKQADAGTATEGVTGFDGTLSNTDAREAAEPLQGVSERPEDARRALTRHTTTLPSGQKVAYDMIAGQRVATYDNGGESFDRYTAIYLDEQETPTLYAARGMSERPMQPHGFGQYVQAEPGDHLGKQIAYDDLPDECKRVVLADCEEAQKWLSEHDE